MKAKYFLASILIGSSLLVAAQNDPVPAYLTTQNFPDSVKNLSVVGLNGGEMSFGQMIEKYRGKRVVLDVWASWCRDCLVGYPKLDKLMQQTSDSGVVYVFLSIDENEQKWKNAIDRFRMRGEHYRLPVGWKNALSSYIALDWVPRYMILNEEGRIVSPKMITADELEIALSSNK